MAIHNLNLMNKNITLSYLVVTKNKLPYLRIVLEKLISQKKDDEDILIADGASTDGTKEYLDNLRQTGAIDHYISEPDLGFAHALNKLMLISKGTLIKIITDDDAFHYPTISACKEFMLQHSDIDVINTNGGVLNSYNMFKSLDYVNDYKKFQKDHKPFAFCELGLIFRRSSIPIIGLRDSTFKRADMEMSLRITSIKVRVAWYNAYSYVNILNPQSVSLTNMKDIKIETDRLNKFYLGKDPDSFIVEKIKIIYHKIRMALFNRRGKVRTSDLSWAVLLSSVEKWLETKNAEIKPEFIYN